MKKLIKKWNKTPITIRAAIIGAIAVIIVALISKIPLGGKGIDLKITSVSVVEKIPFPILDITLENRSEYQVALSRIKLIDIDVIIEPKTFYSSPNLESSYVFNILIDPLNKKSASKLVSHYIEKQSVERFQLIVGAVDNNLYSYDEIIKFRFSKAFKEKLSENKHLKNKTFQIDSYQIRCRLEVEYSSGKTVISQPLSFKIKNDPHFTPKDEYPNLFTIEKASFIPTNPYDFLELYSITKKIPKTSLYTKLYSQDIFTIITVARILKNQNDLNGLHFLRRIVLNNKEQLWDRIHSLRALIQLKENDKAFFIEVIKLNNPIFLFELLGIVGKYKIEVATPYLVSLLKEFDSTLQYTADVYYTGHQSIEYALKARAFKDIQLTIQTLTLLGKRTTIQPIYNIFIRESIRDELSMELLSQCVASLIHFDKSKYYFLKNSIEKSLKSSLQKEIFNNNLDRFNASNLKPSLIYEREKDDFPIIMISDSPSDGFHKNFKWYRNSDFLDIEKVIKEIGNKHITMLHFHNPIKDNPRHFENINKVLKVTKTDEINKAITKSIAEARNTLKFAKKRFINNDFPDSVFFVSTNINGELAFLKVNSWEGVKLECTLDSKLVNSNLEINERLIITEDKIMDWTFVTKQGFEEGNFIGRTLEQYDYRGQ